ncbi:MAG: hypothetical protein JNL70_09510 [Saprospiraceae bacterium]|nr:hypothetical protein [Saprospiraceae bacterium]
MKFFLQLKHWQLFLLIIGVPIILEFFALSLIFKADDASEGIEQLLKVFPILMVLYTGTLFGWLWSVGTFLTKKLPSDVSMPEGLFKGAVIVPVIYIAFICWFIAKLMWGNEMSELFIQENLALILTAHFTSMLCIFYIFYYNAKVLKTVEMQKKVSFGDYIGEFFLFWFFPIGIWILQPRINKLLIAQNTEGGSLV